MNHPIEGVIFDIDGTVARGRQVLPGSLDTLAELRRRAIQFAFFTNDNSNPIGFWVERLADMGIDAAPGEIITSALVAAEVMAELHPASPILAVGDVGLFEALGAKNLDLVDADDVDRATVVVMGKDPNFDQNRLNVVCRAIWNGAKFFATNYDPRLPVAGGFVPATGPMVKAVAYATGHEPVVTGKPSPWSGRMAMRILGIAPERGLVVGDQLSTDIAMGRNAGMRTVLVLTGTADASDVDEAPPEQRPSVVVDGVGDLIPWLDAHSTAE
ncbi:MAG: HAD-IIA family hydrolase [Acidobacteria bacterium]|nr:HAD-IIA family hydrolase [Acidobacteriota bacterium]